MRKTKATRSAVRVRKRARPGRDVQARQAAELAIASLAHDIRTPLTGILAQAELLAASELGEREQRWAAGVKSAAEHLAQLTTIVCDAVRAGIAGIELRQDVFSPRRLAEELAASLAARAQTVGLATDVAISDDLPDAAIGDAVRLRAAIENLLDNAVKFTARGSIRFAASAKPAKGKRMRLEFAVTDSGIGLKADEIRKLFRPFAQASRAVSRRYGGTGLGLSLVKRLARAMGGNLTVQSKAGRGSTFRLSVVVATLPARGDGPSADVPLHATGAATTRNILYVEDNPYGRVLLGTILKGLGHHAEFVGSGESALKVLAERQFDLVLMDIALSGISGLETARRIRTLRSPVGRVPIIGISGSDSSEAQARAVGMNAFLVKPVSPADLTAAIETVFQVR